MKTAASNRSWNALALLGAAFLGLTPPARSQSVQTEYPIYFAGEDLVTTFSGGPGNKLDWVGLYPEGVVPGSVGSTRWNYVDGTQGGSTGLTEGAITFSGGLNLAGVWTAFLLRDDGYDIVAQSNFEVVDPSSTLVRTHRTFAPNSAIAVDFFNGPGNAKDWVGIYKAGETPGANGVTSTLWNYVDDTQGGGAGIASGTVHFPAGLPAGEWVAYLLENDGYSVLSSQAFSVAESTPKNPRLLSVTPTDNDYDLPPIVPFEARIANGATKVVPSSVKLTIDDVAVAASTQEQDGIVTISYANAVLYAAGSTHTYKLTLNDNAAPANVITVLGTFTIGTYQNVVLGQPIAGTFENFDALPEGQLPAGWTAMSRTELQNEEIDFGNLDSAAYGTWTVVDVQRFNGPFVTYSNPDGAAADKNDYSTRVLRTNPKNIVNGAPFTGPLASGRMLFSDSGYRRGLSQVMFLQTRDYDLSGQTGVAVSFHSLWEQNQDSIAAFEYSIDKGATWKPVFYLLDNPDIVTIIDEGTGHVSFDAEATFNTERADIARWIDPDTGETLGGTYGAFIAAPISPALAPFIQGRFDNDPIESKRVEYYRLPAADGQQTVRFRFAHAGTDSWYWGIDDFGLYSETVVPPTPPVLTIGRQADKVQVSWPADAAGFVLEWTSSLSAPDWQPVPNVTGSSATLSPDTAGAFLRLRKP